MSGSFGRASATGHAGEILQGAVRYRGRIEPFLVTLPYAAFQSSAVVRRATEWSVIPSWRTKALGAAQLAWSENTPLAITINSGIPIGRGCGSSTADCVAAVRAVADLCGRSIDNEAIARLVQRAELASDATMFDDEPVAFFPRRGEILRRFSGKWPAMHVECIDLGGPAISTTDLAVPNYSSAALEEFDQLLDDLEFAFRNERRDIIGKVASRSAIIHQRHHPHPEFVNLLESALSSGAYGVAIAHSGTIAAVLSETKLERKGGDLVHSARRRR